MRDEGPATAATTARIIAEARRMLLAGEQVDVGKVAAEAGVDRATVFRRVGRRDLLLAEALWTLAEDTWARCLREVPESASDRTADVLSAFVRYLIEAPYFRTFLHRDPQRALRILTTNAAPNQERMVERVEALLSAAPTPTIDLSRLDLARLLVRVAEMYVYADIIAGAEPDADAAHTVFVALLSRHRN
ncbi:QsdR family transcriptional regulator [Streptomyces roseolus]|uniref:QsdR family transcriptional regulator n=1 Tax=Streptomyces roseolus TaxID=67358 RepID=UPI0033BFD521